MQYDQWAYPASVSFNLMETRSPEERCPTDGVSSDATVLYQDSDVEEDFQAAEEPYRRDVRYGNNPHEMSQRVSRNHVLPSFDSFSLPFQTHLVNARIPPEVFPSDSYRLRRNQTLSWGLQQDLAEYEASCKPVPNRYPWERIPPYPCPPQPAIFINPNEKQTLPKQPKRRNKGGKKNPTTATSVVHPEDTSPTAHGNEGGRNSADCQQPVKSRRRGRRGGRGRKQHQHERQPDEVPKLEKNLEDELAQEMANHISNKSALTHSFSSLRLHVAGGGTMIILNDKEIPYSDQKQEKQQQGHFRSDSEAASPIGVDQLSKAHSNSCEKICSPISHGVGGEADSVTQQQGKEDLLRKESSSEMYKVSRPKGCGAFFPPQILQQLQSEKCRSSDLTFTCSSSLSPNYKVDAEGKDSEQLMLTTQLTNDLSLPNVDKTCDQNSNQKVGTGCFLPAYLQEDEVLEDEAELNLDPETTHQDPIFEIGDDLSILREPQICDLQNQLGESNVSCLDGGMKQHSTINMGLIGDDEGDKFTMMSKMDQHRVSEDLIDMLESHDFTTFTSPLHMEETLGNLQAVKDAQEETEQKLINLQIENEELKSHIHQNVKLQSQLQSAMEMNSLLKTLLCYEINKNKKKAWYKDFIPHGIISTSSCPQILSSKPKEDKSIQIEQEITAEEQTVEEVVKKSSKITSKSSWDTKANTKGVSKVEKKPANGVSKKGLNQTDKKRDSKIQEETLTSRTSQQQEETGQKIPRNLTSSSSVKLASSLSQTTTTTKKTSQMNPTTTSEGSGKKKKKIGVASIPKSRTSSRAITSSSLQTART